MACSGTALPFLPFYCVLHMFVTFWSPKQRRCAGLLTVIGVMVWKITHIRIPLLSLFTNVFRRVLQKTIKRYVGTLMLWAVVTSREASLAHRSMRGARRAAGRGGDGRRAVLSVCTQLNPCLAGTISFTTGIGLWFSCSCFVRLGRGTLNEHRECHWLHTDGLVVSNADNKYLAQGLLK
jgi:hypothetical protein